MTQNPRARSNPASASPPARTPSLRADNSTLQSDSRNLNVTEIARKLVAHGGGSGSISLAFDIVLHDLVERARIATGATGAAIALTREEELVCRATTGANAPDLGVHVGKSSGLVGECVRDGTIQCCSDTELDTRVNASACRRLGVRSMLVAPIVDGNKVHGILQLFSSSPNAFADGAMNSLPQLIQRIAESKRETDSALSSVANDELDKNPFAGNASEQVLDTAKAKEDDLPEDTSVEQWSPILVGLIIVAAVTLGFLIGWHGGQAEQRASMSAKAVAPILPAAKGSDQSVTTPAEPARSIEVPAPTQSKVVVPSGGLTISEDDKVIYRSDEDSDKSTRNRQPVLVQRVEPDYPSAARTRGIQGEVVLNVQVLGSGSVGKLDVISGDPQLSQAAVQAVKRWKYEPSGSNLQRQERVTIRFVLPSD
jgi:TonB family protein